MPAMTRSAPASSPTLRRVRATALAASALLVVLRASASPNYPDALQQELKMPCTPVCTICHTDSLGGYGTVTQPFGIDMRKNGLFAHDLTSLDYAITSMDRSERDPPANDADHDGIIDTDELRHGTNPNGDTEPVCSDLHYGCRIESSRSPTTGHDAWPTLLLALIALGIRRRTSR